MSEKVGIILCFRTKDMMINALKTFEKAYQMTIDSDTNGLTGPNGAFAPEGYSFKLSFQSLTGNSELDQLNIVDGNVYLTP